MEIKNNFDSHTVAVKWIHGLELQSNHTSPRIQLHYTYYRVYLQEYVYSKAFHASRTECVHTPLNRWQNTIKIKLKEEKELTLHSKEKVRMHSIFVLCCVV